VLPSHLVRRPLTGLLLLHLLASSPAHALGWPDARERIERDLAAPDAALRLQATEKLESLGSLRATPLLLRALADSEPTVRVAAAEAAVRMRTKGATELVIPWLGEHDSALRIAACEVARALPDPRAVAPLARALSDADGGVRAGAAEALGFQASADAVAPLLGKLDDSSPAVRVEIARALARLGDRRAVVPLIGKVEDSVADVRQAIAKSLAELGDPRAASAIVLQLRDNSTEVKVVALGALGRLHGDGAIEAIATLVTERNAPVRHAALATLGALAKAGSSDALRVLVGRLGQDDDVAGDLEPNALRDALVAAGDAAVPPLRSALKGGASAAATASAGWILGALHARSAGPDVIAALRRGTLSTAAALHALAGVGTPDDLPVVLELVADDNPSVRREALAAARVLIDPSHPDGRAVEPLVAVTESSKLTPAERILVIDLLGRTGARRAAPLLQGLVGSRDPAVKLAALDALASLGPAGADASLLALVPDPDPVIRLHAALALSASGGEVARDGLLTLLTTGTGVDRATALTALGGVLTRAPSDRACRLLQAELDLATGAERDATLLALGSAAPLHTLTELVRLGDADDRRTLTTALAARDDARPALRALLSDADAGVRAEAAWSLGSRAGADAVEALLGVARRKSSTSDDDAAVDASGAIARIAGRTHAEAATAGLCELARDARALVRANALTGLSLARARCGDGSTERAALSDASDRARSAAARAIGSSPRSDAEKEALARCAATDRSGAVADVCAHPPDAPTGAPRPTLAYVETAPRSDPRPLAHYLVELADGVLRAGTTDRRGAFFDPLAPDGALKLHAAVSFDR